MARLDLLLVGLVFAACFANIESWAFRFARKPKIHKAPTIEPRASPLFLNCTAIFGSDGYGGVGIDFFGYNNTNARFIVGKPNPFFNSSRPTVIHVPGWEYGRCVAWKKTTFNFQSNVFNARVPIPINDNSADYWLDQNWNIGIFQWNSFNEESLMSQAEAKIHNHRGNRAINHVGRYTVKASFLTIPQIFYQIYKEVFREYSKDLEIRLTGNSIGAQVVLLLSQSILEQHGIDSPMLPKRIALLDPYFSRGKRTRLSEKAAQDLAQAGVIMEFYQSSNLCKMLCLIADCSSKIRGLSALVRTKPTWVDGLSTHIGFRMEVKHVSSFNDYFRGMALPPPPVICTNSQKSRKTCNPTGLSASTPTAVVKEMMGRRPYLIQLGGSGTTNLADDVYAAIGEKSRPVCVLSRFCNMCNVDGSILKLDEASNRPIINSTSLISINQTVVERSPLIPLNLVLDDDCAISESEDHDSYSRLRCCLGSIFNFRIPKFPIS